MFHNSKPQLAQLISVKSYMSYTVPLLHTTHTRSIPALCTSRAEGAKVSGSGFLLNIDSICAGKHSCGGGRVADVPSQENSFNLTASLLCDPSFSKILTI